MATATDFWTALNATQEYISRNYSQSLTDRKKIFQLKAYIDKFIRENNLVVEPLSHAELVARIYNEMALYSILTPYLMEPDVLAQIEEVNINGWDDIAITFLDGTIKKLKEHFHNAQHAQDIVKRLLQNSGMIIDNAAPIAQGHLPNNERCTAMIPPVIDDDRGISASIRILHPARINRESLIESETVTKEMLDFLCMCVRYGVPFVIAGATSSGKTTLLNAVLDSIPNNKRVFTIESGARELSLLRRDDSGRLLNNVVHTLSRPSDNESYDITQEDLVVASLRFNPDVVCVGEMRDVECYSAVEASLTGHTVVSTVHSGPQSAAHTRIALLCQKKFPIEFKTSMMQAGQAFPVVVYAHKLENNERKVMDISECLIDGDGNLSYSCLYNYNIDSSVIKNGGIEIKGHFEKPNIMSKGLQSRLIQYGVPIVELDKYLAGKEVGEI